MPDDDCIQYLGTKPASRPQIPHHPFLSSSQRPVTGVALHIEKSATEEGHGLIFRKSEEPVVHIGRRPGSHSDKSASEAGKAFFTCPVVSRHHAKITFSDSGHVYLCDLDSHHGTHIRKRDEALSKRINPQTPTLLADGDVITFGKSVGSDKGLVRPVVARVDLMYGSHPPLKPLVVPGSGSAEGKTSLPMRPPSGRYGVYAAASSEASSSSDELASPDSHDSDIEEISGPSRAVPPPWHDNTSGDATSPIQVMQKQSYTCLPRQYSPSPFGSPGEFRLFSPGPLPSSPLFDRDSFCNVGFDAYSNDIFEDDDDSENSNYSRSTSPMDLSSSPEPAEPPAVENKTSLMAVGEPVIIGAWPRSRSSSPAPSIFSSSFPPVRLVAPVEECVAATPVVNEAQSPEEPEEVWVAVPDAAERAVDQVVTADKDESEKANESSENVQLKTSLATLKTEVAKLHAHRRKYKQRFNDNVHAMGEKFSDLEERTTEAHDLYHLLSDRLEENVDAFHEAQAQLDALEGRMDAAAEVAPESTTPTSPYTDEAKASAEALKELVVGAYSASWTRYQTLMPVAEMTALRDTARKEMADEMKSVREAKDALRSLAEEVQAQVCL
ncbi:hypothetical protein DFH07DRAFT_831708 [Mycena maculata]|uniref:FHA domain-containing protein n=1 Tax=Mycena maculata TaxID=230809 RepID=A0AAD7IN19_9AGAR|nr:hypothetical protein DFH07DRAFT_831708 [Mycena maculata]